MQVNMEKQKSKTFIFTKGSNRTEISESAKNMAYERWKRLYEKHYKDSTNLNCEKMFEKIGGRAPAKKDK